MSLIAELLSKATQTRPRKDVPPGLTNSIKNYKSRERNRKRSIIFLVVISCALVSGFAAVYAARLLLSTGPVQVRPGHTMARLATPPSLQPIAVGKQTPQAQIPTTPPTTKDTARKTAPAPARGAKHTASRTAKKKSVAKPVDKPSESEALRHYYTAADYEREGDRLKAIDEYTAALALQPGNFRLLNKVGGLYMQLGMLEEAARYIEESIARNKRYTPALINRGILYAEMGRFEQAAGSLEAALALEPANTLALFNIALLYEKRSMPDKARAHYMKLKKLGDPQGEAGLRRLEVAAPAGASDREITTPAASD